MSSFSLISRNTYLFSTKNQESERRGSRNFKQKEKAVDVKNALFMTEKMDTGVGTEENGGVVVMYRFQCHFLVAQ